MRVNSKSCYFLIVTFLATFYIYGVKFKFIPVDTSKLVLVFFWVLIFLYFLFDVGFRSFISLNVKKVKPFLIFPFLALVILFLGLWNNADNFTIPLYVASFFFDYILVSFFLVYFCKKHGFSAVTVIVAIGMFQAVAIFSMFVVPPIKVFYGGLVDISGNILEYYSYRKVGLTGFANYTVGTTQALILSVYALHVTLKKNSYSNVPLHAVLFSILFISAAFSSRTALVVIFIFSITFILSSVNKVFFWKKIFPFLLVLTVLLFLFIGYLLINRDILQDSILLRWAIEPIVNYIDFGEVTTKSSDTIATFYFYPGDETFLFGDWKYLSDSGGYYKSVDAGYMRLMLYMGSILSLLLYFSFFVSFLYLLRYLNESLDKIFVITFIAIIMIVHYKGNAFVDGTSMFKIVLIYLISKFTWSVDER